MQRTRLIAALALTGFGAAAFALSPLGGSDYDMSRFAIAAGGGTASGGEFDIFGTIGQHDAGEPLVGGDFSLTGGFWTAADDAPDVVVPADLLSVAVVFGTHLAGDLPELLASDNTYYRARSKPGFSAFEANKIEIKIEAETGVTSATSFDTLIESRINNPNGTANVRFRNWSTNQYQSIGSYPLPLVDQVVIIEGTDATNYVRTSDGRLDMNLKQVVIATFSPLGFDTFVDQVEIGVR